MRKLDEVMTIIEIWIVDCELMDATEKDKDLLRRRLRKIL